VVGPIEGSPHTHTIILLHGRDSQACEFASEFFEYEATGPQADRTLTALFPTTRWVFPQARALRAERFDTDMSQWFDMWSQEDVQERSELQVQGLRWSVDLIIKIIKNEELLVPRGRIFLGGISQGFATYVRGFAGLCGFCSWLPLTKDAASMMRQHSDAVKRFTSMQRLYVGDAKNGQEPLASALVPQLRSIPILLEHSRDDPIISVENGTGIRDKLEKLGFRGVEWHEYDEGGHWIN
ncbi:Alpha/Beta hydrolase protein, partial [Lasiosphaeris hirsuta]